MAKYVVFFNYTQETWSKMITNPGDRLAAVRASAQSVGGDVEAMYFMFGKHDGFVVVDAPDAASAAGISIAVSSTGAVRDLETHELIAPDDLPTVLERAATAQGTYRPPGT
ncbi:GYD domain-containing protein [Actinomycetospora sp. CA-101289]|uniref:GYD domain-containing protein n=1 Tax=Actinomycetospora sp. CA-101289 TaxID=3239893 RepID=UPI003D9707F1